ncbi:MAG TPA: STAS domain-containing protein [Steroidobacteraceae bacterium]
MSKKKPHRATNAARPRQAEAIQLDARMTIVQAAGLRSALLVCLAEGGAIVIDGTRVEEIDTAILQLLASLWRTAAERGIACSWSGVSDIVRRMAILIGIADVLRLPAAQDRRDVAA